MVHPVPPDALGFHRAPRGGHVFCPAKSMVASLDLWSKTQGSHLGVRKRALDLETKGSNISPDSVAYKLCDFGEITPPL